MKKQYITPASTVVSLRTVSILTNSSANSYGNNEGYIRFSSKEEDAGDAD